MPSYTKLFNSIVTSTIWMEDDRTRIVWITMLAICDQNGEVQASIPGLARVAGVPVADCEAAIQKFLSPDPYSRTTDDQGRRIEEIPGGWALLNHSKYRAMASREDKKAANAERQARHRQKISRNAPVTLRNASVTPSNASVTQTVHIAEAEAEAEAEALEKPKLVKERKTLQAGVARPTSREEFNSHFQEIGLFPRDAEYAWLNWEGNGWTSNGKKLRNWKAAVGKWKAGGFFPTQKAKLPNETEWGNAQSSRNPTRAELIDRARAICHPDARELFEDALNRGKILDFADALHYVQPGPCREEAIEALEGKADLAEVAARIAEIELPSIEEGQAALANLRNLRFDEP